MIKRSGNRIRALVDRTDQSGILYVLKFTLDGEEVIKIGVTQRESIEDRVCEILVGIFKKYRVFPECYPKRFRKVDKVYEKEKILLEHFKEYKYTPKHVFGGCTEFIYGIGIEEVVSKYEEVVDETRQETCKVEVTGRDVINNEVEGS